MLTAMATMAVLSTWRKFHEHTRLTAVCPPGKTLKLYVKNGAFSVTMG